jgi:hypothetical protein
MVDAGCAICAKPILPIDNKTTIQQIPYHSACWDRKTRKPTLDDVVCATCGNRVAAREVREGDKVFHLDCYVLYKRRPRGR